jgi:hypothetical protein
VTFGSPTKTFKGLAKIISNYSGSAVNKEIEALPKLNEKTKPLTCNKMVEIASALARLVPTSGNEGTACYSNLQERGKYAET